MGKGMERPSSSLLRDVEHEDIPQTEDVESASAESGGKKRKLLSKIWDDYTFIPSTKVGEPDKVKCKHYDKEFGAHYSEFSARNSPLDLYLNEERMDHRVKLDILSYWKVNAARFKELSLLAMDVLSVPITTVASESTFSVGGRVLNKWRSSLLSENVEALITTRSWLYSYDGYENEDKEMGKSVDFINSNETPLPPNTMSFESGASNTRN